ncbi:MAG: phage/plasmid primase, P4 family [Candidatus Micrarchaeota archaeon]|nr:phage/plasmid primase, P4 family [Candidatus Micrarchaeota archaeon]
MEDSDCNTNNVDDASFRFLVNDARNPKNKTKIPMHLARHMLSRDRYISLNDAMIYKYKNGIYERHWDMISSDAHKTLVRANISNEINATTHIVNETVSRISRETRKEASVVECRPNLICLSNKVLDVNTSELKDHTPDVVFFNKIPVKYDSKANCPKFDKFLSEVVSEDDTRVVYELFGYLLYRGYPIQVAFMLVGEGSNGKSTLIRAMNAFVGEENMTHISLQDICNKDFAVGNLHGKLLNSDADLKDIELTDTGMFKKVTGGDMISADVKGKERISFMNYAKLVFACNKVPVPKKSEYSYTRRWEAIMFNNKFEGARDNKNLINEITTPEELSGILNKALQGLKTIMANGRFSTNDNDRDKISKLFAPVKYFVDMECFTAFDAKETKGRMYSAYIEFCKKHNIPLLSDKAFGKSLNEYIRIQEGHIYVGGVQCETWLGVRLKTMEEKRTKTEEELEEERRLIEEDKQRMQEMQEPDPF